MNSKLNSIINIVMDLLKEFGFIFLYLFIILALKNSFFINEHNYITYTLSNIFTDLIILIIFLYIFRKEIFGKLKDFQKNGFKYIKKYFIFYVIGAIIMIVSNKIINYYFATSNNEVLNQNSILQYPIYSVINLLIIAPIIEELITKVTLKNTFKHPTVYIIVTSLIFASLHILGSLTNGNLYELLYLIPYSSVALSLSYMYIKSDNIWTNITFHSFHNLICLLIFLGGIYA